MARHYKTQRFEVARLLEIAILEGLIKPGIKLPELLLSRELGVSQASVREALQHLESAGLVVKYPNRGSYVIALTAEDLVAIYQLRQELEPMACALAAERMGPESLDALQACIQEMQTAAKQHNYRAHSNADQRFHRLIWEAQPNRYLEKLLKVICLPLFANDLVRRNPTAYLNYERSTRQHTLILRALGTRDPSLVQKLVPPSNPSFCVCRRGPPPSTAPRTICWCAWRRTKGSSDTANLTLRRKSEGQWSRRRCLMAFAMGSAM